jgi:hypothetical protein
MLKTLFTAQPYAPAVEKILQGQFMQCGQEIELIALNNRDSFSEDFLNRTIAFQESKLEYYKTGKLYNLRSFLVLCFSKIEKVFALFEWPLQKLFPSYASRRYAKLYKELILELIFCRYTNFSKGLYDTRRLFRSGRWLSEKPAEYYYALGLLGHFECLGGRFELGLPRMAEAIAMLESDYSNKLFRRLNTSIEYLYLAELKAIRCLHLGYSGAFRAAELEYAETLQMLDDRPYSFVEVYTRSMRMFLSLEELDSDKIESDARRLKEILGEKRFEYYALRVSAYSSLISRIKNDFLTSKMHESICNRHYGTTSSPVELGRYHFLRALIDLEKGDGNSAIHNTTRALSFFSPIPGAYFHKVDGMLLYAEIHLRALYLRNVRLDTKERKIILKKVRWILRIAKLLASSSKHVRMRVKVLQSYLFYLSEQFGKSQSVAPDEDALRKLRLNRLTYILGFIQSGGGRLSFLRPLHEALRPSRNPPLPRSCFAPSRKRT